MRFSTTVLLGGKTATGLVVPPEVVEALGAGKKPPVTVTLRGYSYRSSIAVRGGQFMIPLSAEHRTAVGLAAGDDVEVDVELDAAPREVDVPADLAAALDADPEARRRFDAMSYSHQLQHVLAVTGAKTEETRARRVAAVVTAVLGR
jgi:bifunctional DNA-binding transcriptional regulator/antitoxin component of YhaV-PrlF toxin-antitoxin module